MLFSNTTNFKLLGHFNEFDQIFIVYMHFAHIHEIQNCTYNVAFDTIYKKDRM